MDSPIKPGMMKYCVVGNISKGHPDENGKMRSGTKTFPGGRKVYIGRRLWYDAPIVLGQNRYNGQLDVEGVFLDGIENIRLEKCFEPRILEEMKFMNDFEWPGMWFGYKDEDKKAAENYIEILNKIKAGDDEAWEQYYRDEMWKHHWEHQIMLVVNEYNWGLHSTSDWERVTWTIYYDGDCRTRTYYAGSEMPFHKEARGNLDKELVKQLKSLFDTQIWRKNPPADACDGTAWDMKYFAPGGERLNYSGKPGYIYGEETLERIADLLPKEGVYEAWEG